MHGGCIRAGSSGTGEKVRLHTTPALPKLEMRIAMQPPFFICNFAEKGDGNFGCRKGVLRELGRGWKTLDDEDDTKPGKSEQAAWDYGMGRTDGRTDGRVSEMPLRRPTFPAPLCTSLRTMGVDGTGGKRNCSFPNRRGACPRNPLSRRGSRETALRNTLCQCE